MKTFFVSLIVVSLLLLPAGGSAVEKVRIANIDNFILHKYLNKDGIIDKEIEEALENISEKETVAGTPWKRKKKEIDKDSLAEKTIKEPSDEEFGLKFSGKKTAIKEIVYPLKNSGWTDVLLDTADSKEIILEIEGGMYKDAVHHQVGNIGIKRADGRIKNLDACERGRFDRKKEPVMVISDDYFYSLKDKGGAKKLFDEEIEWEDGIKVLIIRKLFPEVPGEDSRFIVQSISFENDYDNDTVLIMVSRDHPRFKKRELSLLVGWKSKEVSCTSAGGGGD